MATYANVQELYADVQKYLDRDESSIVDKIPMFVTMAENELDRILRHPAAEMVLSYTSKKGTNSINIPTNLLELKTLRNLDTGLVLQRRYAETLYAEPNFSKEPIAFMSTANFYVMDKTLEHDTTFQYIYYMSPDKLGDKTASNLYLVAAGDILLFIALSEAFAYAVSMDEANYFRQKADLALAKLQDQINKESVAGSTLFNLGDVTTLQRYY